MNFFRDILSAPAARTKGLSGMGGGRMAGRATERMALLSIHRRREAFEDAWGNAFLEEGHAAALADQMAEVSAERGADGGEQNEEDYALMLRGEDDDHDVGEAGHGQWDEGAVDNGDQEDAKESEAEKDVYEGAASRAINGRGLGRECCEVLHRVGSREQLHT